MGVVYEARDRRRGMRLALKMLASEEPSLLYRLKREFRSLTDLRHPNLVSMYELISEKEIWFYTMELVQGVDLMTHVRRAGSAPGGLVDTAATSGLFDVDRVSERLTVEYVRGQRAPRGDFDPERLRNVLGQLVLALRFLHDHGKIHRDIKPSNVLVTPEGRAVLLDFGIVTEVTDHGKGGQSTGAYIVGTGDYMAPEQAEGEQVSEKADWYALGVLLFEALTGGVPFSGNLLQVLLQKQTEEPPSLGRFEGTAEEDLAELCADLLKADPNGRPTGEEIAVRLGISAITGPSTTAHDGPRESRSGVVLPPDNRSRAHDGLRTRSRRASCQARNTVRSRSSASCVRPTSIWERDCRSRRTAENSRSPSRRTTAGARSTAAWALSRRGA